MSRKDELIAERNALNAYIKSTKKAHDKAFDVWLSMEGKYGTQVYDEIIWPHDCGYHYEYATPADKEKEEAEREAYWRANRIYSDPYTFFAPERARLEAIENELCLIEYGMTTEERNLRHLVENASLRVAEAEQEPQNAQKEATKWQSKLDAYLDSKVDV